MNPTYAPMTQTDLDAIAGLEGFAIETWLGPALPRPANAEAIAELLDLLDHLVRRAQYLIQAKDGLTRKYTLRGETRTGERFMLGTEDGIEQVAALDVLTTAVKTFLDHTRIVHDVEHAASRLGRVTGWIADIYAARSVLDKRPAAAVPPVASGNDLSALPLEGMSQFSMAWTSYDEVARLGFEQLDRYVAAATDPEAATADFWRSLSDTALPYNLLILQRVRKDNAQAFRTAFGQTWSQVGADATLASGRLFGIDLTLFDGIPPLPQANGTTRFTPSTMMLLEQGDDRRLRPVAVRVADPQNGEQAAVYTQTSPSWIYALMAVRTSMTVHGIWIGHVYTLHLVTAAMQMTMWNVLPPGHVVAQALRAQSQFTIAFDVLLLIGWSHLSPPTSIGDAGTFLALCSRYAERHDFFSGDPLTALDALGLEVADFTSDGGEPWDLYPNVRKMLSVWKLANNYAACVVRARYATDLDVADDLDLQQWIDQSAARSGGNVRGLPPLDTREALQAVLASLFYRINFHALGRLRDMGNPDPSFAPNFPPCLQSSRIPGADDDTSAARLLAEYLPRTGTIGGLISFYDLFAFSEPYVPLVPAEGFEALPQFDPSHFPGANEGLYALRRGMAALVREWQPEWVQISQLSRSIEL